MGSTQGTIAPLHVDMVYLFESHSLLAELTARGIRPGIGSSLRRPIWETAMIYPEARNPQMTLSQEQREVLSLFAGAAP